ncbi:MAG: folate family ECF transporter S component [Oscillospiraceae bacterium]|nr:folate family ECF transporter S component [Oscillospiraceae bacterium]
MKGSNEVRNMVLAALFAALDIVTTRLFFADAFLPPGTTLVRVSLQFLCYGLAGWLLGPGWTLGAAVTGDIVGSLIRAGGYGAVFPGVTLICALAGLTFGLILYRRPPKLWRALLATGLYCLLFLLPLMPLVFYLQYGTPYWPMFWASLPWRALLFAPYGIVLFLAMKALDAPLRKAFR